MRYRDYEYIVIKSGRRYVAETFIGNTCMSASGKDAEEACKNLSLKLGTDDE